MYDAIIIGGGASGVMCAIVASERKKKILLIDSDIYPAKKLMLTGNGRCNLTNINMSSDYFNQNIDDFFSRFGEKDALRFFEKLGLVTYVDEEGRVYPYSRSARSVVDVLNAKLKGNKVEVKTCEKVMALDRKNDMFEVTTDKGKYLSEKVVVATGTFLENKFLKGLGFSEFRPSLCALKSESTKKLSGIRLSDVEVTAKCNGKMKKDKGEVLFKDDGLSGIVIFNISSIFARENSYNGEISLNLMPNYTKPNLKAMITSRLNDGIDLFKGWFQDEVASLILKKAKVEKINKSSIDKIVDAITDMRFEIKGFYPNNQIFAGGISLDDLTKNLESKSINGLYFTGEVIDVDGECGGYNLQWAWTSGFVVGENL